MDRRLSDVENRNVAPATTEKTLYLIMLREAQTSPAFSRFTAYDGNAYRWFGPFEVNINYYPQWIGPDRILVLDGDWARRIGL